MSSEELRSEARAIAGSLRALLEQLAETGADAVPSEPAATRRQAQAGAPSSLDPRRAEEPRSAITAPITAPTRAPRPPFAPATPAPTGREPPREARALPVVGHAPEITLDHSVDHPADREVGLARLGALEQLVAGCHACPLHQSRTRTVFARGNPVTELMFVGEGPGAEEDAQGLPFVGKAGQLLDRMIAAMGYAPAEVYVANVVKCRPPNNRKPEPAEMQACEGYLHEQIAIVRPKVIVALGATACEGLLKVSGITRLRGTWRLYRGAIPVMPTFHPAYLLRTPEAKRDVWSDLQQVMAKLGKAPPPRRG